MKIQCAHTVVVPIKELKLLFNPRNPNQHTDAQLDRLAFILEYQGARKAATISKRSGLLTAGHGRILAAEKAGWDSYPVDYQDYESDEMEYADLVADNAVSDWSTIDLAGINAAIPEFGPDFDIDLLGIKDFVLEPAEKYEPGADDDEVPEHVEPKTKLGDVYQLGRHRLMCGDSLDINSSDHLLNGESIELMFTDPPYGINIVNVGASSKSGFVGASSKSGFVGASSKSGFVGAKGTVQAREYKPIIGDDKDFDPNALFAIQCTTRILWGANYYASRLPDQPQWLVWDKKLESGGLDHNNFSDCELAWTDAKGKAVKIYRHVWAGMVRHGDRKDEMSARVHPTQKPVGLCAQIINDFSDDGESVLDLFGGSGSTLIACEKTNRKCFMMELDPYYTSVIIERWMKYTGQMAYLINEDGTTVPWSDLDAKR